jgi:hypothetical protein
MVEHRTWELAATPMPAEQPDDVLEAPEGPCLVCGEWVSGERPGYRVRVSSAAGATDVAAHADCLAGVTHPAIVLPLPDVSAAEDEEAAELEDGSLDPDEASPALEPWDEGADDET